jgi:tRNA nucleotidyltransferase/poly(A) polymerase
MKIYLVGGAVRDYLLNIPTTDRDYLVVGSTPEEMMGLGYIQVGSSFPVFLHPKTKEEYALARTEIKCGVGYRGFEVGFGPNISLERDLYRRDITINSMAMNSVGTIYDPYGGCKDLEARIIRHVSSHFKEDPLRVLRVMRFMAKLHRFKFIIAPETRDMMLDLINTGELVYLSGQRVLLELQKVFLTNSPHIFFELMHEYEVYKYVLLSCQSIPKIHYASISEWQDISYSTYTGLAFLSYHITTSNLALLEKEIPLSRVMSFHCKFVHKWLANVPHPNKEHVEDILKFVKDIKVAYYSELKVITKQLVHILHIEVDLNYLWNIYDILHSYPYNEEVINFKNFTAKKLVIQRKLILKYLDNYKVSNSHS